MDSFHKFGGSSCRRRLGGSFSVANSNRIHDQTYSLNWGQNSIRIKPSSDCGIWSEYGDTVIFDADLRLSA